VPLALVLAAAAIAAAPTDPSAPSQQPLAIMRVGEALDHIGPQLADVPVLTADTGLDLQHPDIAPRLFSLPQNTAAPDPDGSGAGKTVPAGAAGWDLLGGADGVPDPLVLHPDMDPSDENGHGTAVAGLLGAAWNNGQGGAGVAPNARFVALRTCWGGDQCYQYVQTAAFNWAADRGVRVVSMSWLVDSDPANQEPDFRAAITQHPNVLFVAIPSGNDGFYDVDDPVAQQTNSGSPYPPYPCSLSAPNVLCVTTSSPSDGLDCGAYGASSVDVAVPTQNSFTTFRGGGYGDYGCATSWAAPTAAGLATILFGIDPTATAAEVRSAIVDSARKVPAFAGKSVSGGVADAVAAVDLFQSRRGIRGRTPGSGSTPPEGPNNIPPSSAPGPVADTVAPVLKLAISPVSFRAGGPGARLAARRGARLRIGLTEPAAVRITIKRRGARRASGILKRSIGPGTTMLGFAALDKRGRRLGPGHYTASAIATDPAGNKSRVATAGFTVKRG
jgi:hypothetical protein